MSDMKTITILRLSKSLNMRVATVAAQIGQTNHAFMLQAIDERVNDHEAQSAFVRDAQQAVRADAHLLMTLAARPERNVKPPTAADWARIAVLRGKLPRSKLSAAKLVRQMRDAGF